ncbi:MAG: NADH-quinone oxidoreductase subunit L [Chloroflexi bacterium]|nr:NADH-quinone oxidoreductase subunit L [Chloroflexota bacterium]
MSLADLGWAILFLPLISFVITVFLTRSRPKLCGYVTIAAIGLAFLASLVVLVRVVAEPVGTAAENQASYNWVNIPGLTESLTLSLGVAIDPLAAFMLVVVTGVSLLVQIYSQGYMAGDPGYSRYYAFMSLFTASMLGLVLANNLIMVYFFWELVGLCSYLLIGFWFQKPAAAAAAKKAFIVTRLGDLGFLVAILWLVFNVDPAGPNGLNIAFLNEKTTLDLIAGAGLTWAALGIFAGAVGKSAQFPLHVWLPDAMEGPTPVSALIHAATMVAAGVYLVARMFPLFEAAPDAMVVVAFVGGFTAIFAASMGLVMHDVKRVMAYSTVSQLGYMMMALGVGGLVAGIFHLFNHAFFKALLFLGSGSMIHGTGTQDMREMGGLRRAMPVTFITVLIASLSLSGIPPFSGFWSKDEILADTLGGHGNVLLFALGLAAAFMTAFYMFRMMFVAFGGSFRGPATAQGGHTSGHTSGHAIHLDQSHSAHAVGAHESPRVMTVPLIVLAILAVLTGFLNVNGWFGGLLEEGYVVHFNYGVMASSVVVALAGIFLAYAVYGAKWISAESLGRAFGPAHKWLTNKYYLDHLYEGVITRGAVIGICAVLSWFDHTFVDGIVNGVARLVMAISGGVRKAETGRVQAYALVIFAGVLVIMGLWMLGLPNSVSGWVAKP